MRSLWQNSKPSVLRFEAFDDAASDRIVDVGIVFAIVGVTVQTATHALNAVLDGSQYLSVNGEGNPITWAHSVAIFAAAFVCMVHATALVERRGEWAAMAAILAFLSFDEMLVVHERIVGRVLEVLDYPVVWDSVIWPVLYLPILGTLVLLLVGVAGPAPARPGRLVLVGLAFLGAAVAAEIVSAPISGAGDYWPHALEGAFEEGAELAGWILITTGLAAITLAAFLASSREGPVRGVTEALVPDVDRPAARREQTHV